MSFFFVVYVYEVNFCEREVLKLYYINCFLWYIIKV